jgi:hypothetical protein
MPREGPSDVVLAVIGNGFGALQTYGAACYLGFEPEQIGIFGERHLPVQTYQQYAWNLGQTVLRSESESHFAPADWPTFAQLDAYARRRLTPILRSGLRKLNPGVPDILAQAGVIVRELGYERRVLGDAKVGWIVREPGPPAHFSLYDEDANLLGRAKHVAISVGHGPLSFPGVYGAARRDPRIADHIVQAYEPKRYVEGHRYVVVGSGIAGVNEWVNALDAGAAKCIALRRNPQPDLQDLNVPRCLFDGSGIDAFEALSFEARLDFLSQVLKGTAPQRRNWGQKVKHATEQGRFEELIGSITSIEPGPNGLRLRFEPHGGGEPQWLDADGVVCSTGFVKSALAVPLFRRLVQTYGVPVEQERIRLKTNCGVPPLDREDSRLCVLGFQGNTVVPNADTISGLKYQARRFVSDVARAEGLHRRSFHSRVAMQMRLSHHTVQALRHIQRTEQLA